MAIGKDLFELENKLGYKFSDIKKLETALTHSSYSNELRSRGLNLPSSERYEFLGDAVLEIVVSEYLFENFKNRNEGSLTKMRQNLVCERTLSKIATELGLGDYINLGRGEEISDCRRRPKVLADALEAVFAAIYLDSDKRPEIYKSIIFDIISLELEDASRIQNTDCKTLLQQLVEKDGAALLEYVVIDESGPEHDKVFTVGAKVNNNLVGKGVSKSKKDAEMKAAEEALRLFGVTL